MHILTLDQIKTLTIGSSLYEVWPTRIFHWYYGGINPRDKDSIILISSCSINTLKGIYVGDRRIEYYTDYEEAVRILLVKSYEYITEIRRMYLKL